MNLVSLEVFWHIFCKLQDFALWGERESMPPHIAWPISPVALQCVVAMRCRRHHPF